MSERGLHEKYGVFKDGSTVEECFVLEPRDDPAAIRALKEYASATDNDALSEDITAWVNEIEQARLDDERCPACGSETWEYLPGFQGPGAWECDDCGHREDAFGA